MKLVWVFKYWDAHQTFFGTKVRGRGGGSPRKFFGNTDLKKLRKLRTTPNAVKNPGEVRAQTIRHWIAWLIGSTVLYRLGSLGFGWLDKEQCFQSARWFGAVWFEPRLLQGFFTASGFFYMGIFLEFFPSTQRDKSFQNFEYELRYLQVFVRLSLVPKDIQIIISMSDSRHVALGS